MKIHRFIGSFDTTKEVQTVSQPEIVHQMGKVLKLEVGEAVVVADGKGSEAACSIAGFEKGNVLLGGCRPRKSDTESARPVVLCLALLKKDNFELAVQKAVEVGVAEILPLLTERTIKQGFARPRLEKIIKEAVEQSSRGIVPSLRDPIALETALFEANRKGTVLFCDTEADAATVSNISPKGTSFVFVGPEGGWTDNEREMAKEVAAKTVSLAPTVLRAETAAILATYLFTSYSQG